LRVPHKSSAIVGILPTQKQEPAEVDQSGL
jgi:hypothetical protein